MRDRKLATKKRDCAPIRTGEQPPPSEWKRPTSSRDVPHAGGLAGIGSLRLVLPEEDDFELHVHEVEDRLPDRLAA